MINRTLRDLHTGPESFPLYAQQRGVRPLLKQEIISK